MTLLIPDLSEWNTGADLGGIRNQNGGAAIIRAAYGADHPDRLFGKFRAAAGSFSFLPLYQYLVAGQDVMPQVEAYCKIVGRLSPHEVPILDLEEGAGDQWDRADLWCDQVDKAMGLNGLPQNKRSWVYSGQAYAQAHGLTSIFQGPRRTWVAAYRSTEPTLGHTLWQSTNGQSGAHITSWPGAGRCDTSVYHGTLAELSAVIARP